MSSVVEAALRDQIRRSLAKCIAEANDYLKMVGEPSPGTRQRTLKNRMLNARNVLLLVQENLKKDDFY